MRGGKLSLFCNVGGVWWDVGYSTIGVGDDLRIFVDSAYSWRWVNRNAF